MSQTQPGDDPRIPDHIRHPVLWIAVLAVLAAVVAVLVITAADDVREDQRQDALAPFYAPPSPLPPGRPGSIIRTQPLGVTVPGARALRVLYRSQDRRGAPTVSSGMVFIPTGPTPAGGRPVVSWAHGTVGLAPQCAPTRLDDPLAMIPWAALMVRRGWIVTATDYAGLGTPGVSGYLIAADEGHDVINAVRAARALPGANASPRWAAWGHSQGGQSALAAGDMASTYAPELDLAAIATAAPAAELRQLLSLQWNQSTAWVIGADVVGTWPAAYSDLDPLPLMTANGRNHWQSILGKCIAGSAITAIVRQDILGQDFFATNPWDTPAWRRRFIENTPRPTPQGTPLMVAQSLADEVVLPRTTARLVHDWCRDEVAITTLWLDEVSHNDTGKVVGPAVTQWLGRQFAGAGAQDDCASPLPIDPAP